MSDQLQDDGFTIVANVLDAAVRLQLARAIEPLVATNAAAGVRGLAHKVPAVAELARSACVRALVEPVLGAEARLVRSILFNKDEAANWHVAWHQDLAIAVQSKADVEGFISWSTKEGVLHVQPPVEILESMLTVRLHLDDADESNGALWVSPGSHRLGRMPAAEAAGVAARQGEHLCKVQAGDALLFRPLILHASRKANSTRSRRVIHLEFAGLSLPPPLSWAEPSA